MDFRDRFSEYIKALPVVHRVVILSAVGALAMGTFLFAQWVTAPTYTMLYSDLDDASVAQVIDQLESDGVPYRLEGGGSRVMVPRDRLHRTRATLAAEGISGTPTPKGYELLEEQGLSVSDFRQRVDFRRALEGELARTLAAMDKVSAASVHLVIPERQLFEETQTPATASVLLDTRSSLNAEEIDTVTFLVGSAVEGLESSQVTVADVDGRVLHAPGESAGVGGITSRQLRHTREFEDALAGDIASLLERITGDRRNSVVVRAVLNFDERTVESETFDPASAVALREELTNETYQGNALVPGGPVGVDGGPLVVEGGETDYERDDAVREFGVDRIVDRRVAAPGEIDKLSVAIVMDDGSITGATVPPLGEVEELVSAALGLELERGDSLAVSALPFPVPTDPELETASGPGLLEDLLPRLIGVLVLLVVSVALFLMTRGRRDMDAQEGAIWGPVELTPHTGQQQPGVIEPGLPEEDADATLQADVHELVQRQPEEIAGLLRSWLANSR